MSSLGIASTVAGVSLAQAKGSEVTRSQHESVNQQRQLSGIAKAEAAAGIGVADGEDHNTQERDADGRRLWEETAQGSAAADERAAEQPVSQSKDATGERGNQLDLLG